MLDIYCIGAALFGALMGYFFGWSVKKQKPNTDELTMLMSTVLGGAVTNMLAQFHCAAALPIYVVGIVIGIVIYFVLLRFNWPAVSDGMNNGAIERPPVLPWRVPAAPQKSVHHQQPKDCGCKDKMQAHSEVVAESQSGPFEPRLVSDNVSYTYDSVGRLKTLTYQNGTAIQYNYDSVGNRTSVVTTCPGGTC